MLVEVILRDRSHPEQGFRSCVGIMRLAKPHGPIALEAACERALVIGARPYSSVNSILKKTCILTGPIPPQTGPRSSTAMFIAPAGPQPPRASDIRRTECRSRFGRTMSICGAILWRRFQMISALRGETRR